MIRSRMIVALAGLSMAPLALGCLLELSPRPGSGVVHARQGTTIVVVEAGAEADAGPLLVEPDAGALVDAGAEGSADASDQG